MYCYSLLSHFREMVRSFLFLGDNGYVPAGFLVCRCLFEMGAHSYYVHKHVQQYRARSELREAWEFLHEINMGSLYLREQYPDASPEFVTSRQIGKIIRCFDEWVGGNGKANSEYSFLSEFAHPNMGAFSHYYEMVQSSPDGSTVKFSATFPEQPLPHISIALVSTLHFSAKLLESCGESNVAAVIHGILKQFGSNNNPPGIGTSVE
jgi:hypothetical protein